MKKYSAVVIAILSASAGGLAPFGRTHGATASVATDYVTSAPRAGDCSQSWGSLPRKAGNSSSAPLHAAQVGQHDCYDRVVFRIAGPANGYHTRYVKALYAQAKGQKLTVHGGAILKVTLLDPAYDVATGKPTYWYSRHHPQVGEHVAVVNQFQTLRDLVYAGSFEGSTSFGIGTRARLPFRAFVLPKTNGITRVVVDVAHRWS